MTVATSYLMGLSVISLHEFAHIAAAIAFGITIKRMGFSWKGVYIVRESGPPKVNMAITLAGPLLNLLLAATWPVSHNFAMVNVIFGLSNLLPFAGSDGERAWKMITKEYRKSGLEPSRWLAERIGIA